MDQKRFLITGANGQLGRALRLKFPEATFTDSSSLDITNMEQLENFHCDDFSVVINAAAYTSVDEAESPAGRKKAWQVNAVAVSNLAKIANEHDLTLVHISTDYVFDGLSSNHTEEELLSPLGVYGQSKAAGDIAASVAKKHYIIRTSWVVGDGSNFVRTMLGLALKGINPKVVGDQSGRPTFTSVLADSIDYLLSDNAPFGIYNVSNEGPSLTWADLTRAIFSLSGHDDLIVNDITTQEYFSGKEFAAPRPKDSTFNLSKIEDLGFTPPSWNEDLKQYIKEESDR